MTRTVTLTAVVVALLGGCKDKETRTLVSSQGPDLRIASHRTFVLEAGEVKLDKLIGDNAEREFRFFLDHNHLLLFTLSEENHVFTVGMSAPAASYGMASYTRVRGRSDHLYVRVPAFTVKLVKDDGTTFTLDVAEMRIEPREAPDANGVISQEFKALIQGSVSLDTADGRMTGELIGTWTGKPDDAPPQVTVIPPAEGLVSGAIDVYFDEPVDTAQISSRVYLRNGKGERLKTRIHVTPTDIPDFATHLRVETADLLPFSSDLTLAVGTEFQDLAGHRLEKPEIKLIHTPDLPPLMSDTGNDFAEGREEEYRLQGDAEVVPTWLGLKPYEGRFLKLRPPPPGSRRTTALVSRMHVAHDADWVQVRVAKVARTRDPETPCLRYVMAAPDGLLWNVECGPKDVPATKLVHDGDEYFTTPWIHLNINVVGQRGRDVVLVLEARPLEPDMKATSAPVFLVDMIRTVWEGQDPNG